jgi:hypothetical protein
MFGSKLEGATSLVSRRHENRLRAAERARIMGRVGRSGPGGTARRIVANASDPAWSPDGRMNINLAEVALGAPTPTQPEKLKWLTTDAARGEVYPAYSPDVLPTSPPAAAPKTKASGSWRRMDPTLYYW